MKKKTKLIMSTFAILFVAMAIIGTVAYFSKSFTSDNNTATAASFDVDVVNADDQTIGDGEFNLGDTLLPGMDSVEAYRFQVKKVKADVPVEYSVILTPSGDLFPANADTPVTLTMQRNVDDLWVDVDHTSAFDLVNNTDGFRILVDWPHGDNDIDFQGKPGHVKLEVIVSQADQTSNDITGDLVNTTAGKVAVKGKSEIVIFQFEDEIPGGNSGWNFRFNDGDGANAIIRQTIWGDYPPEENRFTGEQLAQNLVKNINNSKIKAWTEVKNAWDLKSEGTKVFFTSKEQKHYENVKITISYSNLGHPEIPENQINEQSGVLAIPGVKQVNTLTVNGTANKNGNILVTFNDGIETIEKTITVSKGDQAEIIAAKITKAFSSLKDWDAKNKDASADIVFTSKTAAAHKDIKIKITNN